MAETQARIGVDHSTVAVRPVRRGAERHKNRTNSNTAGSQIDARADRRLFRLSVAA